MQTAIIHLRNIFRLLEKKEYFTDSIINEIQNKIKSYIDSLSRFIIKYNRAPFYLHILQHHFIPLLKIYRQLAGFDLESHENGNKDLKISYNKTNKGGSKQKAVEVTVLTKNSKTKLDPKVNNLCSVMSNFNSLQNGRKRK